MRTAARLVLLPLVLVFEPPSPAVAQTVACGFTISEFADVPEPTGLAFAPPASAFGSDLFVASITGPDEIGGPDLVLRVDANGVVTTFSTLVAEADPVSLEFPPVGSPFGDLLYVCCNNRDFGQPLDQGGAIQTIDAAGIWSDFALPTGQYCGTPASAGLGEPNELAFGTGGSFGYDIYVPNSTDYPCDIVRVGTGGGTSIFVDDGLFSCLGDAGMRSVAADFAPGGAFGTDLWFSDFNSGVRVADASGAVSAPFVTFPTTPSALAFGPGGGFGTDLYVAAGGGTIYRVKPDASYTVFASGFGGVPADALEFSPDGTTLYVADPGLDKIFRITAASACGGDAAIASYGAGKPGAHGVPTLSSSQLPMPGQTTDLRIDNGLAGAVPILFFGLAKASLPFDGGTLLVDPLATVTLFPLGAGGSLVLPVVIPCDPALCGFVVHFQAMHQDPAAAGFHQTAQTNGLTWTLGS